MRSRPQASSTRRGSNGLGLVRNERNEPNEPTDPFEPVEIETPHEYAPYTPAPIRWLSRIEVGLAMVFFALIFFGVMYQVIGRYVPSIGWVGAGEVARLSQVALTFILAGYLVGRNGHIVIEVFDGILEGKKLFTALRIFASTAVIIICGALVWESILTIEAGWARKTTVLHMPLAVLYMFAFVGFASGILHSIVKVIYANKPEPKLDITEMEG